MINENCLKHIECPTCGKVGPLAEFGVQVAEKKRHDSPGLITLLWDFIENGESSYGLSFFDLREKVRAKHGAGA